MSKVKSPTEERRTIFEQRTRRPYGAILRVHVQTAGAFGQVEEVGVPLATGAVITLAPARKAPWDGGRKYSLTLEGFATAAAAEAAGRRLVQAVLWMAVSSDAPVRLEYQSYEPFSVFERTRSDGSSCEICCEQFFPPNKIFGEIQGAYAEMAEPDPALLLSMEVFSGARLEASDQARLLAIVSALEPLAEQRPLGADTDRFVEACLAKLKEASGLTSSARSSLEGRVSQLRRESIRQALRRVVQDALPARPEAVGVIEDAYALRSQIVHSGRPADLDVDLERESQRVSSIIREIYSSRLGRDLLRPTSV